MSVWEQVAANPALVDKLLRKKNMEYLQGVNVPPPRQPDVMYPVASTPTYPSMSRQGVGPSAPPVGPPGPPAPESGGGSIFDDPAAVEEILAMGGRQSEMGRALQNYQAPDAEGQYSRRGIYTAAHPLEHLVTGLRRYKGGKDMKRLEEANESSRMKIIEALRGLG